MPSGEVATSRAMECTVVRREKLNSCQSPSSSTCKKMEESMFLYQFHRRIVCTGLHVTKRIKPSSRIWICHVPSNPSVANKGKQGLGRGEALSLSALRRTPVATIAAQGLRKPRRWTHAAKRRSPIDGPRFGGPEF